MFDLQHTHPSWHAILKKALASMDQDYLKNLQNHDDWLPGKDAIFNAFSLPLDKTRYILFGESPYPRKASANGYAFWDKAVHNVWSAQGGLSKPVNRATSLRNFIKMLLVSESLLQENDTSPSAIQKIDKSKLISTLDELFQALLNQGFLLLNTSLVLSPQPVNYDSRYWLPFMESILNDLHGKDMTLILFGNIAKKIKAIQHFADYSSINAEHPYNISFICNKNVQRFFKTLKLLVK
jgi:uracil-DNA glycosylase